MNITDFFEQTLGAKLKNPAWSWGAEDPAFKRVFLRVWEDEIKIDERGEMVQVFWKPGINSNGHPERREHLEAIRKGAKGIAVVCRTKNPGDSGKRSIGDFDADTLLHLGGLTDDDNDAVYAYIIGRFPVEDLRDSRVAQDLASIQKDKKAGPTTKIALTEARLGQGKFRSDVLQLWNRQCAVTGAGTLLAIRASHIKPWRSSTNEERLDPSNGLPLVASQDALFDVGLISFDSAGQMLISQSLDLNERQILGLVGKALKQLPSVKTATYLEHHRASCFKK